MEQEKQGPGPRPVENANTFELAKKETLHELVRKTNELSEMLLSTGGELTPEMERTIEYVSRQLVTKVDACAIVIERMEMEQAMWAARAEQYAKIAKAFAKARERVREMVKGTMLASGVNEITGDETRFALVKGKPKVVMQPELIDPSYKYEETRTVIDTERVEADLKQGIEVLGAKLEDVHQLRKYAAKGVKK